MALESASLERRLALAAVLGGLAVALAGIYIPIGPTKAFPVQHMVNVIAGVLLGPVWAGGLAAVIGVVRISLGLGTIYAIPGGIPGAVLVGLAAKLLRARGLNPILAGLAEPIGTAVIGFLLALFVFAPIVGDYEKWIAALTPIWLVWLASTAIGTTLGMVALGVLEASGLVKLKR
ncbi:MAG: energy coupling factor transporter S component ThiW [Desulfurococcales archaeon]|nr:energy coupling factor transporter S component ThiW [Desulfurococcales archaeon]